MKQRILKGLMAGALAAVFASEAPAETFWMDLTHPIPTFKPVEGRPTKSDVNAPWLNSRPHVAWDQQAILTIDVYATDTAYYDSGTLVLYEHHGTHLDAINHTINNEETLIDGGIPNDEREDMASLGTDDLIGPIVLIDIGPRVRAELDKNGGIPSPDVSVTDFSDGSANVVTAEDIDAVADQLKDGVWIVLNLGWAGFYLSGDPSFRTSPYFNSANHPGMSRAAVDRLAEIIDERGLKLGGIAADNITIDTGEGTRTGGLVNDAWHSHTVLMQRGVLFVENLAKVDELATTMNNGARCTLVIGAPKHVRGTGGPSRVFAMCED